MDDKADDILGRIIADCRGHNPSQTVLFSKHGLLGVRIHFKLAVAVRHPSENQGPESCVAHAAIITTTTIISSDGLKFTV